MSISSCKFRLLCCTITHYNYKGKMAKISPKIHKIEIWPKSRPKVINSPNKNHRLALLAKVTVFGPKKNCTLSGQIKILRPLL